MSCGPEITGLSVEENVLKVTCSDAQSVRVESYGRLAKLVVAEKQPLREVEIQLDTMLEKFDGDPDAFIYITVTAPDGSYAVTRPYYIKDLL